MSSGENYPRDLIGYGSHPPDPCWPGQARIAVSLVLNYEEGGEACVLHGDAHSESVLTDLGATAALPGARVSRGDALLTLEAMKMETAVRAEIAGEVAEVLVRPGQPVEAKDLLVVLRAAEAEPR